MFRHPTLSETQYVLYIGPRDTQTLHAHTNSGGIENNGRRRRGRSINIVQAESTVWTTEIPSDEKKHKVESFFSFFQ